MRITARTHWITLGVLVGLASSTSAQGKPATRSNAATSTTPAKSDSLYSGVARDFIVGKKVYLRSSKTRIGVIRATDSNHAFPPSFPSPRMKAVLIQRTDGPFEWTPVVSAVRLYVVNKQ